MYGRGRDTFINLTNKLITYGFHGNHTTIILVKMAVLKTCLSEINIIEMCKGMSFFFTLKKIIKLTMATKLVKCNT